MHAPDPGGISRPVSVRCSRPCGRSTAASGTAFATTGRRRFTPRTRDQRAGQRAVTRRRRGRRWRRYDGHMARRAKQRRPGGRRAPTRRCGVGRAAAQRPAAAAQTRPVAAMNSVVFRVAAPASSASRLHRACELECPPPRAPRRDFATCPPEIGARRGNSPVQAVSGGRPVSLTTSRTTGRIGGPTTGRAGGPTTGRTHDGRRWGRTAALAAA